MVRLVPLVPLVPPRRDATGPRVGVRAVETAVAERKASALMTYEELDIVHHWCEVAAQAAASKKADDTVILDVGSVLAITDSFVITSAPNVRLVRAIAEEIERRIKEEGGLSPRRVEGHREGEWILLDYGDFVVHVFLEETRRFYDLERLWADAPRVTWDEEFPAAAAAAAGEG